MLASNKRHVRTAYNQPSFTEAFAAEASADTAVIIHLYYTDMFSFFFNRLQRISALPYDLYLTIPEGKEDVVPTIREQAPNARIAVVPNCGRDVLPFVQVMKQIEPKGYSKILKLHSKKSPHRTDGEQWRDKIVDSLIPSNSTLVTKLGKVLNEDNLALIGPNGEYVSLLVNFTATAHYLKTLTGKILGGKEADELIRTADEYGFFAGTMFWARTDALWPIVHNVNVEDFEPELGQEDSTLAHALERLFNIIPELQERDLYELQDADVVRIDPHTTNIPEWSEVALEDEED
jgi:lipopolysaccharide biosynthesis protein